MKCEKEEREKKNRLPTNHIESIKGMVGLGVCVVNERDTTKTGNRFLMRMHK